MTRTYCPAGYYKLPTGCERRLPDGRTIQAHGEGAREALEKVEGRDG